MRSTIIIVLSFALGGCHSSADTSVPDKTWNQKGYSVTGDIKTGIPAYGSTLVSYERDDVEVLNVKLGEPVIVTEAKEPRDWGYYQFPSIYKSDDSMLVASWHMAKDAVEGYGQGRGYAKSGDNGQSWSPVDADPPVGGGLLLPNGDQIKIYTPKALKLEDLTLPPSVGNNRESYGRDFTYYKVTELPRELQGVYLERLPKGGKNWVIEQATLEDSLAVRYTDTGMFPVVWWGDMQVADDGSIIAGIYPGFTLNDEGGVDPSGVLFYRSTDEGRSWKRQGEIPYQPDLKNDPNGDKRLSMGFTEPAFEILSDGTFLCVLRTADGLGNSPMYISRSTDLGKTWSKPGTITRNGVLPCLLQLENGVTVLSSGRPGVQLRFSTDQKGMEWTDPFEMLPFENEKRPVSCGYTQLQATGKDTFIVIYSDFNNQNQNGDVRKAIKVREITVKPI